MKCIAHGDLDGRCAGAIVAYFTNNYNEKDYFEANYPEFGSRSRIGMFLGPGFVFGVPTGGTVKVIPFLNYKDKISITPFIKMY